VFVINEDKCGKPEMNLLSCGWG